MKSAVNWGFGACRRFDQAEIEHLGDVALSTQNCDENVGRFQIAVDHAQSMGLCKRFADLSHDVYGPASGKRTEFADEVCKAQAGQVFHYVIKCSVLGMTVIEDLDCVRMRKCGSRLHFALEARQRNRIALKLGIDEL